MAISTASYHVLLAGYPARFRREYGPHMAQVFRDCCLSAYHSAGISGMVSLWTHTLFDWFKSVIEEQTNRATEMTPAKFIRLSGWAMVLSAASFLLGFLADATKIRFTLYRIAGVPGSRAEHDLFQTISESISLFFVLVGVVLLITGTAGLRLRYGDKGGTTAQRWLNFSMLGGVFSTAGILGLPLEGAAWMIFTFGLAAQFGGLALFGAITLRTRLLPWGNGLPLLAGFWFPTWLFMSLIAEWVFKAPSLTLPVWVEPAMFSTVSLSLAVLGFILQGDARNKDLPA